MPFAYFDGSQIWRLIADGADGEHYHTPKGTEWLRQYQTYIPQHWPKEAILKSKYKTFRAMLKLARILSIDSH